MRKIILGLIVFMPVVIYADVPLIKVNCDDVKLSINTVMNNRFNFGAYWNEPAKFPNTPRYIEVGDSIKSSIKNFRFSCPDFSVSYDGYLAEIKAKDYNAVLDHISKYDYDIDLYSYTWYKYKNIREGIMYVSYGINLRDFNVKSRIYESKEGDDLDSRLYHENIPKEAIIGYKVDGGELKPLLYNRKIGYYLEDFKNARTIDIYNKYPNDPFRVGETIKRIYIDKNKGILRIYRNYPFPSR